MTSNNYKDLNNHTKLVHKLTNRITGLSGDALTPHFKRALQIIASNYTPLREGDEFHIVEKVKKKFLQENREKDALKFLDLYQKLQSSVLLKNRWAVLCFLSNLQLFSSKTPIPSKVWRVGNGIPFQETKGNHNNNECNENFSATLIPTLNPSSLGCENGVSNVRKVSPPRTFGSRVAALLSYWQPVENNVIVRHASNKSKPIKGSHENLSNEVPEAILLREIVYTFQGIEGKIMTYDSTKDSFRVEAKYGIPLPVRKNLLKLAELGWLYNKVQRFCETRNIEKTLGLVGQSFIVGLQQELTEYYRLLAVLEAQLQLEEEQGISTGHNGLTLRRLAVWTFDPMFRMKILASLVDASKTLRGGALVSIIHSYLKHGDPNVKNLVCRILAAVSVPIYSMLRQWILDGELEDNFQEFFVASDPNVNIEKLWHEKYRLRKTMVPSFFTMNQAKKILSTGKSINFLRQVCQDRTPLRGRDAMYSTLEATNVESLFKDHDSELHTMIDLAYRETSFQVLDVMHSKYKFMDHLKAMRRYLLLGQGDFIRHLMDLLDPELRKPASSLYLHNLSGILETAIRATNAQFDEPDILKRLDVRLMEISPGDYGWDVFSLTYHVDGPIGTIFTQQVMMMYLRLFNSLWRAKRMEYVLSAMWQNQIKSARVLKSIPELEPVLHQCFMLTSEMVHFVQQMQYYITFEVMECSWDVLENKVKSAHDLDCVIAAHEEFLDTIMTRSLLDESSKDLLTQLRTIYDLIITFKDIQDRFLTLSVDEVNKQQLAKVKIESKTNQNKWGTTEEEADIDRKRRILFIKNNVASTRSHLRIVTNSYQDMVQKFLLMLTNHTDINLQFLSFRLDFNEHYKKRDSRLVTSLTFQHRRLSAKTQI